MLLVKKYRYLFLNRFMSKWLPLDSIPRSSYHEIYLQATPLRVFSSPEPKARVSYCHSASSAGRPSVVRPPGVNFSHFLLLLQNRLMDFDETWWGWSTHGPLQVLLFFGQIPLGRSENRSGGPLLQETSSSDQKATETNRMHSSDLESCGKKCCYFWFHSEVKFLTRFDVTVFLDFFILPYFNAISMIFYALKCLIYIYFV